MTTNTTLKWDKDPSIYAADNDEDEVVVDEDKETNKGPEIGMTDDRIASLPNIHILPHITSAFANMEPMGIGFGYTVLRAQHIETKTVLSLKAMPRLHPKNALKFSKELEILRSLKHRHIVKPLETAFVDKKCYYIATEHLSGGTLMDRIGTKMSFSTKKRLIKSMLSALESIHSLRIVMFLSARNVVFDALGELRLVDFAESVVVKEEEMYTDYVGRTHYV